MKGLQIVLVLAVLLGVVFLATFSSQYLGTSGSTPPPAAAEAPKPSLLLTFPATAWPAPNRDGSVTPPAVLEHGIPGAHDFWFENKNDVAVTVGVLKMNCVCTSIGIALAPEGWKDKNAAVSAAAQAASAAGGPFAAVKPAPEAAPPEPPDTGLTWTVLEPEAVKPGSPGFDIPAGHGGWIRIKWKGDRLGQQFLETELWTMTLENGIQHKLQIGAHFLEPVRALPPLKEQVLEAINSGDKPKEAIFTVFSATRKAFSLSAESEADQKKRHPFVRVAPPEPFSAADLARIQNSMRMPVLSAYRVIVRVHEKIDGRQIDVGPYRATVKLQTDAGESPFELTVGGVVTGDVTVLSDPDTHDRIRLDPFVSGKGVTQTVQLEAPAGVGLAVDQVPSFLKADLKEDAGPSAAGKRTWNLTLTIGPNKVSGTFPRTDDLLYRDTAIYLKTLPEPSRRIRVPVSGTATLR